MYFGSHNNRTAMLNTFRAFQFRDIDRRHFWQEFHCTRTTGTERILDSILCPPIVFVVKFSVSSPQSRLLGTARFLALFTVISTIVQAELRT